MAEDCQVTAACASFSSQLAATWTVYFAGYSQTSPISSAITIYSASGLYNYFIPNIQINGQLYCPQTPSGIASAGSTVTIKFSPAYCTYYTLTFMAEVLPPNKNWTIEIFNSTGIYNFTSYNYIQQFTYLQGTQLGYKVFVPSNTSNGCTTYYFLSPSSGSVTLTSDQTIYVDITPQTSCTILNIFAYGIPQGDTWEATITQQVNGKNYVYKKQSTTNPITFPSFS